MVTYDEFLLSGFDKYTYIPPEVVEKAWTKPEGKHTIQKDGIKYAITRDKKMVVARVQTVPKTSGEAHRQPQHFIVAFPKPEHKRSFHRASWSVLMHGPAQLNRRGIGTVGLLRTNVKDPYELHFIQSHFKTKKGVQMGDFSGLSRSQATRYGGWKIRAFNGALDVCEQTKTPLIVRPDDVENWSKLSKKALGICESRGMEVDKSNPSKIVISPRKTSKKKRITRRR